MKPKISLITLGVADVGRALKFYHEGLGFPLHNYKSGDEMVMFAMEGSWLGLYPREKLAEDARTSATVSGFDGITLAHNVKSKAEVDSVVEAAVRAGARLVKKPQDTFWGGYSGYFADPDGHLWEVAFNPFTDLS
jgi:uncharacterized protein